MKWEKYVLHPKFKMLISCILLLPLAGFAQHQITPTDSVKNVLVKLYNSGNEGAIYNLSDSSFKKVISRNNFAQWMKKTRKKLGRIRKSKLSGKKQGMSIYKTTFQNARMNLMLRLNSQSKITGLLIKPVEKKHLEKKHLVQSNNPLQSHVDSLVDKAIRPYIQRLNTVGVSAGILYHGKYYTYDYGRTGKDDHQLPNENTIYEIGSITKTFTATLLAIFSLEGKCNLNDAVNKYLPANIPLLQKNDTLITLKMLANHTSGLPRMPSDFRIIPSFVRGDPYKNYDTLDLFHYLDTVRLRTTPGTHYAYSNLGFGLLGVILERISGLSYGQLIEKYICDPLSMNDTRVVLNKKQRTHFADGYKTNGTPAPHWHFKSMAGAGAIRSSVSNMMKYLAAHLSTDRHKDLDQAFRLCEKPTFQISYGSIGLAWVTPNRLPGTYWKNGLTAGFSSFCAYNLQKQVAIVILSNSALSVDNRGTALIRKLLDEK